MLVLLNSLVMNFCCFPVRIELNPKHTNQKAAKKKHTHTQYFYIYIYTLPRFVPEIYITC